MLTSVSTPGFNIYRKRITPPHITEETIDYTVPLNPIDKSTDINRYLGIELNYFRTRMSTEVFSIFVDFIGEEEIGLTEEDITGVYYPEE